MIGGICSQWGTRVPFWVAAGLAFANFLYGYFILPESLSQEKRRKFDWKRANPLGSLKQMKTNPIVWGMMACMIFVNIAHHAVQSNWSYFTILRFNWTDAQVGYSLGFVGLLVAIVQGGLIRVVIPKFGQIRSLFAGLIFSGIGMLLFALATQGWMMYAFLIPFALGGLAGPAIQGIMSNQVEENAQGELLGGITSLISLTSIIGPLIMNNTFAYFTREETSIYLPGAPFYLATLFTFLSILAVIRPLKKLRN